MNSPNSTLSQWHQFVEKKDLSSLDQVLAEDVLLRSPFYWKPKEGKKLVKLILTQVLELLEDFSYQREWVEESDWALEFSAQVGELQLKGVDLIRLNPSGQIQEIEVMIRPATALKALVEQLDQRLKETL